MYNAILIALMILSFIGPAYTCTSAVISGKATNDGRPLLWKHRDTDNTANKLVFVKGSSYDFVGVANRADTLSKQIWMGANEVGFAIMNTASYNLNEGQSCTVSDDQEGLFMRAVLEVCSDLADFEAFMDSSEGHWGLAANFGVIDAKGGASFYEKGYYDYFRYDATDPKIAPDGYLIRTNFSISGVSNAGYGFIRQRAADKLFSQQGVISVDFILEAATRNLKHGLTGRDLRFDQLPQNDQDEQFVMFQDYIVRHSSASTLLIQGVLPSEDPQLTTLWTILGWQPVTLVTPVWVRSEKLLPDLVCSYSGDPAPINAASLKLKESCFPIQRGNGQNYLLHSRLTNRTRTGIMDIILPKEAQIIEKTKTLQNKWRKRGISDQDLRRYNKWLDTYVRDTYKQKLDVDIDGQ